MDIILLEQVKKLGNVGDVVTVKSGYARNFLIPNEKALLATRANKDLFEARKAEIEKNNAVRTEEAKKSAKAIESKIITVISQAGEDGRLYGSVNSSDIANALNNTDVARKQIVLHNPIKYIGVHSVEIAFHGDVTASIHVNIARTEDEAKNSETRFKRGEKVMEGPGAAQNNNYDEEIEEAASDEAGEEEELTAQSA